MSFWRTLILSLVLIASTLTHAQESASGSNVLPVEATTGAPSVWGVSFYSLGSVSQQQIERSGPSYFTYNYLALNYKLSKTKRFSLRPVFQVTSAGKDRNGRSTASSAVLGDAHVVYADYEIATIGTANVSTSFKFYLPTSEGAKTSKMILKFRPETFITWEVGRYDNVTYGLKPDLFVQSQQSFADDRGRLRATPFAALEHYLEYGASLNKTFTLKPSVGFIENWMNPDPRGFAPSHRTEAKIALGLDIRPMKGLSFLLSAENRVLLTNRRGEVAFFRPEDNGVVFITSASL